MLWLKHMRLVIRSHSLVAYPRDRQLLGGGEGITETLSFSLGHGTDALLVEAARATAPASPLPPPLSVSRVWGGFLRFCLAAGA